MSTFVIAAVLIALHALPSSGQGVEGFNSETESQKDFETSLKRECGCNLTNSHCDELGVCRCDPGWGGQHCDHCVPMPGCVHGSCQQPWQCSCDEGWAGRFCDKDLSVCSQQHPCQNGASCVMEDNGDYTCLCPEGFHGRHCQLKAGPCHKKRSPCKNGGQCDDDNGFAAELMCRCLAGFMGPRCETNVDDCLMKPCGNGATCLDGVNRFSCLCPAGFTGRFCTVNMDDCASRPCLNSGRCLDRTGGFHCVCTPGYTGPTCETLLRNQDGWEGGGGGVSHHMTTESRNYGTKDNHSRSDERLFRVTVSERSAAGLSQIQLTVVLALAVLTLAVVALTAGLVLHTHCRNCGFPPCWSTRTSSLSPERKNGRVQRGDQEQPTRLLNGPEAEKKKLNLEIV